MLSTKKIAAYAAAGTLATVLAFGALAPQVMFAQETPATAQAGDGWAVRLAERLGVTEAELLSAVDSVAAQILSQAVSEEALTQEEADAIDAALSTAMTDGISGSGSELRDLMRAVNEIDFDVQAAFADALDVDASTLGGNLLPGLFGGRGGGGGFNNGARPELKEEEQAAMTARHEAVSALQPYLEEESFQNAITGAYQAAIDAAVADGALTDEQAAALEEQLNSGAGFALPGRGGHGGRGMGPGGMDGRGGNWNGIGRDGFGPSGSAPNGDAPVTPSDSEGDSTQG